MLAWYGHSHSVAHVSGGLAQSSLEIFFAISFAFSRFSSVLFSQNWNLEFLSFPAAYFLSHNALQSVSEKSLAFDELT